MSIKISQLPLKIGTSGISTGELPISINGITYKINPSQLSTILLTPNSAVISDAAGNLTNSLVSSSELLNLQNSTGNIQQQLNNLSSMISGSTGTTFPIDNSITPGITGRAPSQDAVYQALTPKANVNSPSFIGTPQTPNVASGDNSTFIANTAFVQQAILPITNNITSINNAKTNTMAYDGSGVYYPTVDAVNELVNLLTLGSVSTGFISSNDTFTLQQLNSTTLRINLTSVGFIYKSLLDDVPYNPINAIQNIYTVTDFPLSNLAYPDNSNTILYVGLEDIKQLHFSPNNFETNNNIVQLGLIHIKTIGGVNSFFDSGSVITKPSISNYNNLEISMLGLQSNVLIKPNNDMTISNADGVLKGMSVNWGTGGNNDIRPIAANPILSFAYITPGITGTTGPFPQTTNIDQTQVWNGTALVNVGATSASVQRVLYTLENTFLIQYGELEFTSLNTAVNQIATAPFTSILPAGSYVELCRIAVNQNASNLSNESDAVFIQSTNVNGIPLSTTVNWGKIFGTINDQTDLSNILNTKPTMTGVTGNVLPKIAGSQLIDSSISDNGSQVYISGATRINGDLLVNSTSNGTDKAIINGSLRSNGLIYTTGININGVSLNSVIEAGFYQVTNSTNVPWNDGGAKFTLIVEVNNVNGLHITQTATVVDTPSFTSLGDKFTRTSQDGGATWALWFRVVVTDNYGIIHAQGFTIPNISPVQYLMSDGTTSSGITDANAIHLTGNEGPITGTKTFSNQAIVINNNSSGYGLVANNNSFGAGIFADNTQPGNGIQVTNEASGNGILIGNTANGLGMSIRNVATGIGLEITNEDTSTERNMYIVNDGNNDNAHFINTVNAGLNSAAVYAQVNTSNFNNYCFQANINGSRGQILQGYTETSTDEMLTLFQGGTGSTPHNPVLRVGHRNGIGIQSETGLGYDSFYAYHSNTATGNAFRYQFSGVDKAWLNNNGEWTAQKFVKQGGQPGQYLMADGSTSSGTTSSPYKKYVALVSQSSTGNPTNIILENTLGATPVWTRNGPGNYTLTLANAFTFNKTWVSTTPAIPFNGNANQTMRCYRNSNNDVSLITIENGTLQDSALTSMSLEIRVYN